MAALKPADHPQLTPGSETLKYQTWVLKVLIHCDGCTKRVMKILQGIEGVYMTEIDSGQNKVTVTGNVDTETLIRKLTRSGKSVELWPEEKPADHQKKDKKSSKSKGETEPVGDPGCIDDADDNGEEESDPKEKSEGGDKKKKKKKKKNKGASVSANNGGEKEIISTETIDAPVAIPKEQIITPPVLQQHGYNPYPPHMYYSHPPPFPQAQPYGLSYNTSYPVSTSSAYYVGAHVMPMHANYFTRIPPPPPPSNPINNYGQNHDYDEYEGGYCSVM